MHPGTQEKFSKYPLWKNLSFLFTKINIAENSDLNNSCIFLQIPHHINFYDTFPTNIEHDILGRFLLTQNPIIIVIIEEPIRDHDTMMKN